MVISKPGQTSQLPAQTTLNAQCSKPGLAAIVNKVNEIAKNILKSINEMWKGLTTYLTKVVLPKVIKFTCFALAILAGLLWLAGIMFCGFTSVFLAMGYIGLSTLISLYFLNNKKISDISKKYFT